MITYLRGAKILTFLAGVSLMAALPFVARASALPDPASLQGGERIIVEGIRVTQGGGVNCPVVRADNGFEYAVSYLPPDIAIGDRVRVAGEIVGVVNCLGWVINVESLERLD